MATIRWCPIFPKWDSYQPLLLGCQEDEERKIREKKEAEEQAATDESKKRPTFKTNPLIDRGFLSHGGTPKSSIYRIL